MHSGSICSERYGGQAPNLCRGHWQGGGVLLITSSANNCGDLSKINGGIEAPYPCILQSNLAATRRLLDGGASSRIG